MNIMAIINESIVMEHSASLKFLIFLKFFKYSDISESSCSIKLVFVYFQKHLERRYLISSYVEEPSH